MITKPYANGIVLLLLFLCLVILAWWGLFAFSAVPISAADTYTALMPNYPANIAQTIIREIRLPRVIETILVGAGLAVAGLLMQTLTRNPLASPGLFGVNAGAALGVALVSTLFVEHPYFSQPIAAMLGGCLAWSLVMILGGAWKIGSERRQLVLAGIAVAALCSALTRATVILVEDQATGVMTWLAGSFAGVSWSGVFRSWPPLVITFAVVFWCAPQFNLLVLGDERAQSLGMRLAWIRVLIGISVLAIVAVCVSEAGSIAFVGLIVPHMARKLFGYDHRWLLPGTALIGAILALGADILSRWFVFPTETPAGAVLALIGAPCFIYLVRSRP
jgi:iron complex transport system permease protein